MVTTNISMLTLLDLT